MFDLLGNGLKEMLTKELETLGDDLGEVLFSLDRISGSIDVSRSRKEVPPKATITELVTAQLAQHMNCTLSWIRVGRLKLCSSFRGAQ